MMPREKFKRRTPRDESAEARHWGGSARSSDEGAVMGLERRGRNKWLRPHSTVMSRRTCECNRT